MRSADGQALPFPRTRWRQPDDCLAGQLAASVTDDRAQVPRYVLPD
jgi:hypothetical protein